MLLFDRSHRCDNVCSSAFLSESPMYILIYFNQVEKMVTHLEMLYPHKLEVKALHQKKEFRKYHRDIFKWMDFILVAFSFSST